MNYWGFPIWLFPILLHGHPQWFTSFTHPHLHPMASSVCMTLRAASMSLCRWIVSTYRMPSQLCETGGKNHTNMNNKNLETTNGRLSTQSPALQNYEKAYDFLSYPSRGNKKCEACVSIEKYYESLRIPIRKDTIFPLKPFKDIFFSLKPFNEEWRTCLLFKCKDNSMRLQETWKIKKNHDATKETQ